DVFFVISGYLISTLLMQQMEAGTYSLVDFYHRRARRILPALFFVLLVSIPIAVWLIRPAEFDQFVWSIASTVLFVSNIYLYSQSGYFEPSAETNPLLHTWSLGIEEQFYILFPLALCAVWKYGPRAVWSLALIVAVCSLVGSEILSRLAPDANFYLLPSRAWELMAGVVCALLLREGSVETRWAGSLAALGLAAILTSFAIFGENTRAPSLLSALPVGGTMLLILFAGSTNVAGRLLSSNALVGIGLVSFSAYLWHQPVMAFFTIYMGEGPSRIEGLLLIAASLVAATLTWKFVEQPFRSGPLSLRRPVFLASSAVAAALMVLVALSTIAPQLQHDAHLALRYPAEHRAGGALISRWQSYDFARARFDDNACRFSAPTPSSAFTARFKECRNQHGPALMIIGDSNAMNVFNAIASTSPKQFVVGLTRPGCRPAPQSSQCDFAAIERFIKRAQSDIALTLFHQSGAYLIADSNGEVDSAAAFKKGANFTYKQEAVDRLSSTLARLANETRLIWLGPFTQFRSDADAATVFDQKFKPHVMSMFAELDHLIAHATRNQVEFVPINEHLQPLYGKIVQNDCLTVWDKDHWSTCGEERLGHLLQPLVESLMSNSDSGEIEHSSQ
ncbi:MAG: acyltransferase family protein, partial [Pseudomonadota bacterium]